MVKMFRDSHLRRYFSKIGTSKLQTRNASDATESVPSIRSNDGGVHAPITKFGSSTAESVVDQQEYPACDP